MITKSRESLLKSNFCVRPFISMYIEVDGSFRFCCVDQSKSYEKLPSHYKISNTNPIDIFNNKQYQLIRTKLIADMIPETCIKCFHSNIQSELVSGPRIPVSNRKVEKIKQYSTIMNIKTMNFIELWFENKCNLKCRMCSPYYTNQLIEEWSGIINSNNFMKKNYVKFDDQNYNWTEKEESWNNIFSLIREIFQDNHDHTLTLLMAGGEPILIDGMYRLLDFCIQNNLAKNIILSYKTNFTVLPSKLLKLWSHFKEVQLSISVDGYDKTFEYIRYPAKWQKLLQNLDLIKNIENIREVRIHQTIQAYSILTITDLLKWCIESSVDFDRLTDPLLDPNILNVRILPKELKDIAAEKLLNFYDDNHTHDLIKNRKTEFTWLAKYLYTEDWSHLFDDFIKFTKHIDKTRNQNIIDIMPEIEKYL